MAKSKRDWRKECRVDIASDNDGRLRLTSWPAKMHHDLQYHACEIAVRRWLTTNGVGVIEAFKWRSVDAILDPATSRLLGAAGLAKMMEEDGWTVVNQDE